MAEPFLDFKDVLAESIEAVEHGELTDQECLEQYPVHAHHLAELLPVVAMLRDAPLVEPRPAFKQQSPGRLLAQLPAVVGENGSSLDTLRHTSQQFNLPIRVPARRRGMVWTIVLTLFATLLAGTGILYAADTAVPGDALYALDRSLETLQLSVDDDPGKVVALRLAQAEERLYEAQTLAALGETNNMHYALAGYSESIFAAGQSVRLVGEGEREGLAHMVDEALPGHDLIIASLLDADPDDEDPNNDAGRCSGDEDYSQAQTIAEAEGVPVEQVKEWYCSGLGYGEIQLAFTISHQTDITVSELLHLREDLGWGRVMQAAGMIGSGKDRPHGWEDGDNATGRDLDEADEDAEDADKLNRPADSEDPDAAYSVGEPDEDDREEEADRCVKGEIHPQAQAISEAHDVPVEQVMAWFCSGFGFGEIKLAFRISNQSDIAIGELLEQRENQGWGQIMQDAGLIGKKDEKPTGPPDQPGKPDHAGPLENKEASKDDKSPADNGPPDHAGPPENKGSSKEDKSPKDSDTPDPNGKPDHAGPPENKESSKDDKSPKDNGPPEHNSPSGAEKERNKPEKPPKDKKSEKSENSKKG